MGGFLWTSHEISGRDRVDTRAAPLQGRFSVREGWWSLFAFRNDAHSHALASPLAQSWIMGGGAAERIQVADGRQAEQIDK